MKNNLVVKSPNAQSGLGTSITNQLDTDGLTVLTK